MKANYALLYSQILIMISTYRINHPEMFLGKGVLKICSKFTGENLCRSAISIKLQSKVEITLCNFIEITLCYILSEHLLLRTVTVAASAPSLTVHNDKKF